MGLFDPINRETLSSRDPQTAATAAMNEFESLAARTSAWATVEHNDDGTHAGRVHETDIVITDNTTNNVSTSVHGLVPKAPGDTSKWFRGDASWSREWTIVTTTATGTQNDFDPGIVGNTIIRCNPASLLTITGFTQGYDGQHIRLVSIGAGQVDLAHNTGSSANHKLSNIVSSAPTSLAPVMGAYAEYVYDATSGYWRLMSHEQGTWLSNYNANYFNTSNGSVWAVTSGQTPTYYLRGKSLEIRVFITLAGVAGAAAAALQINQAAYGNYVWTHDCGCAVSVLDAGGTGVYQAGQIQTTAGSTILQIFKVPTAPNWTAGGGAAYVVGTFIGEVN